ncbi:MAG: EAL domain-containing response regulator [Alphaproteobacteria bacterium]|nr:EAL domain-containing response regulator [Alphaproteobacteria bacterium]
MSHAALPTASRFTGRTVLIADDDEVTRTLLSRMLTALGVGTILVARDGDEAIAQLNGPAQAADMILCDLKMPGMDGIEALRHLAYRNSRAAIVVVSGAEPKLLATVRMLADARGLRLLGALRKPIRRDSLESLLDRLDEPLPTRPAQGTVPIKPDELDRGIRDGEIVPHYQPKVALSDRAVLGVEALVRWSHPKLGLLGPGSFIAAAEDGKLMDPLSDAVLAKAIAQAGQWRRSWAEIGVAVNMSVSGLCRLDLPERIASLCAAHGVMPEQVTIEVTETGLIHDIATVFDVITRLGLLGITLSIDDFGTGYSTLQQLVRLPFGELKLDQSFVRDAAEDARVRIVLESNVELARRLDLKIVGEGIETDSQWQMLSDLGCDVGQGYWIAKPMDCAELVAWSQAWLAGRAVA